MVSASGGLLRKYAQNATDSSPKAPNRATIVKNGVRALVLSGSPMQG